jgi:hypothetical protein
MYNKIPLVSSSSFLGNTSSRFAYQPFIGHTEERLQTHYERESLIQSLIGPREQIPKSLMPVSQTLKLAAVDPVRGIHHE